MNKNTIIIDGTYKDFKKAKNLVFKSQEDVKDYKNYLMYGFTEEVVNLCLSLDNNEKCRRYRERNEIIKWVFAITQTKKAQNWKAVFITLTFTDKVLESTSKETRRRYVQRYLKDNCRHYIGNIDFGKENGREHYHVIALIETDIDPKAWKYGFNYLETINVKKNDIKAVTRYVLKLNNHSYKDTTKLERLIYDRNEDKWLDFMTEELYKEEYRRFSIHIKSYMYGLD